ncbi:MAG: sugar phosphate isomerase/epimerase [Acidobacteria bacterium]|nr:MAG: sugar phosphate isomerase/epimerase [Acidobacteriota bacterium]
MHRREFLFLAPALALTRAQALLFQISLAEWSFHRALQEGQMEHLDFARVANRDFGIDAIEYVNVFFMDKARDRTYLNEMKSRADGEGVRSLLIMCDREGDLGNPDDAGRSRAIENHRKWVEAAAALGCHSIRVNARSDAALGFDEQQKLAADGLRRLCELADPHGINVIVENHGGISSNGAWLAGVMKRVDHPRVGTLPDFGNFLIESDPREEYDRYKGVEELMPYAKAVSAKSHDFDASGNEIRTDYERMLRIVLNAGYHGYIGIEYEGDEASERDGVRLTKALLERVRDTISQEMA